MERGLEKTLDDIMQSPGVRGAIITDKQGLCLGVKGNGTKFNSGGVCSFANAAAKLDSNHKAPQLILLESPSRHCLIQQRGDITGAIYKLPSTASSPSV